MKKLLAILFTFGIIQTVFAQNAYYSETKRFFYEPISIGPRKSKAETFGKYSFVNGLSNSAWGKYSHAEGEFNSAEGKSSFAGGKQAHAGYDYSWVWNGKEIDENETYNAHGIGTFNVNPLNGIYSFYIGDEPLNVIISNIVEEAGGGGGNSNSIPFIKDRNENYTAVTIGSRNQNEEVGISSIGFGNNVVASGDYSHAEGSSSLASNDFSYVWSGQATSNNPYGSNGEGTFNIDPVDGTSGFYIGEKSLHEHINEVERNVKSIEVDQNIIQVNFNDLNEQYFARPEDETGTIALIIPPATQDKYSKLVIYVEEIPSAGFHYDFDAQPIVSFRNFNSNDKLWITSINDSVWKFEFKSIPGTCDWFCDTFIEYPLSELVDPTVHSYTRAIYPDSITDYEISGVLGQNIIEKNNLVAVEIGSNVTSIVEDVFESCTSLVSVVIPGSVTCIGSNTFIGCSNLMSVAIGNGVTEIGEGAFDGCGLNSVTIPRSVTNIENWAFWNCSGLTNISVSAGNPQYSSANDLLLNKDGTTVLMGVNGNVTIPNSVTNIGKWAFSGWRSLTSVTIPDSVTRIGIDAFYDCGGLTSITIPSSVTFIGMGAFSECKDLTSAIIGNGVTSIESYTFSGCSGLTEVTIPNSVTGIGIYAFDGCTALESVVIPDSVTSIGYWAFYGCSSLRRVYCTPGSESATKELMRYKGVSVDELDFLPIQE